MTSDERYILEVLLLEIDRFRKGRVVRLLDTPRLLKSLFQDSLIYLEHGYARPMSPCGECRPFIFVPLSNDLEDVPCHHTFLNEAGMTMQSGNYDAQPAFEYVVTNWLRARIAEIKDTSH